MAGLDPAIPVCFVPHCAEDRRRHPPV